MLSFRLLVTALFVISVSSNFAQANGETTLSCADVLNALEKAGSLCSLETASFTLADNQLKSNMNSPFKKLYVQKREAAANSVIRCMEISSLACDPL